MQVTVLPGEKKRFFLLSRVPYGFHSAGYIKELCIIGGSVREEV